MDFLNASKNTYLDCDNRPKVFLLKMSETPTKIPQRIQLGSPASMKKPIPHILFLITSKTMLAKIAIIRILLNFHLNVNPQFTWGFELVNKRTAVGKRLQSSKHAFEFNLENLKILGESLESYEGCELDSMTLTNYLRQIPVQCEWNSSQVVPFQSPIKRSLSKVVNLRNYLFIVGSIPHNPESLSKFLTMERAGRTESNLLTRFASDLGQSDLWSELITARISTNWIMPDDVVYSRNSYVVWSVSQFLKTRGGVLLTEKFILSREFSSLWKNQKLSLVETDFLSKHRLSVGSAPFYSKPQNANNLTISLALFETSTDDDKIIVKSNDVEETKWIFECLTLNDEIITSSCKIRLYPANSESVSTFLTLLRELENRNMRAVFANAKSERFLLNVCEISGEAIAYRFESSVSRKINSQVSNIIEVEPPCYDPTPWLTKMVPNSVIDLVSRGIIVSEQKKQLHQYTLGIWDSDRSFKPLVSPSKIVTTLDKIDEQPEPPKLSIEQDFAAPCSNLDDILAYFKDLYLSALFESLSVFQLLNNYLPKIYEVISGLTKETDPVSAIFGFYSCDLLLSIPDFDARHRSFQKEFEFLVSSSCTTLDDSIQAKARRWFFYRTQKSLAKDSKSILKDSLKSLKEQEYFQLIRVLLQIVICLECLRIMKEYDCPFPPKQLLKAKSKRKGKSKSPDMNSEFSSAINLHCDRLIISNVDEGGSKKWIAFYENIVRKL